MKTTNQKSLFTFVSTALLGAATLLSVSSNSTALAFEKIQGQDKTGKNCERKDTSESSTFGKCESVCKDKDVTRDAENNRWVCSAAKSAIRQPNVKAPNAETAQQSNPTPKPKTPKAVKGSKVKQ